MGPSRVVSAAASAVAVITAAVAYDAGQHVLYMAADGGLFARNDLSFW